MDVILYKNYSDNNYLDKSITTIGTISGTIRDDSPLIDPVITIEDFSGFNPASCNYVYISDFNRYYYVREIILRTNKLYEMHLHVDVLMSFKSGIRSNTAVIAKQEREYNLYLSDTSYKAYANPHYNIIKFPSGFSGYHYILTVAGS